MTSILKHHPKEKKTKPQKEVIYGVNELVSRSKATVWMS